MSFWRDRGSVDEIMERLEIIVNEMMSDDGPTPMDLGNVGEYEREDNTE